MSVVFLVIEIGLSFLDFITGYDFFSMLSS